MCVSMGMQSQSRIASQTRGQRKHFSSPEAEIGKKIGNREQIACESWTQRALSGGVDGNDGYDGCDGYGGGRRSGVRGSAAQAERGRELKKASKKGSEHV